MRKTVYYAYFRFKNAENGILEENGVLKFKSLCNMMIM